MNNLTENALKDSLKKLMRKKSLNKITISDIVNDCGVSRRTFYYHFQDVYELLEWIYITEAKDVISENRTYETWHKGFREILNYLLENKEFVFNTYNSIGREYLETRLYNEVYKLIYSVVDEISINMNVDEDDKKYVANFYKFAFVGLLLDWIKHNMVEDIDNIIKKLDKILSGDFKRALIKFSK